MAIDGLEKILNDRLKFSKLQKGSLELNPPESPKPPKDNLLHVYMGKAHLLLPNTSESDQFEGIETGALATCSGIALYVPQEQGAILGIAHLAPSQGVASAIQQFNSQLLEAGLNLTVLCQKPGFLSFIPGQTTLDRGKSTLRNNAHQIAENLQVQFPQLKDFPDKKVSYSVLSGHTSSSVKLFKDGRLVIAGEGKSY